MMELKKESLLTIVIPVYNGEEYIERCLNSIINQTYKNLDIIIVNDGSTDKTQEICEKYLERDNRIRLISHPNMGVAASRKKAVETAKGEYVSFVDSDDYIELDMFEILMPYMKDVELVTSGYSIGEKTYHDMVEQGLYCGTDRMSQLYKEMVYSEKYAGFGVMGYLCMKIFRTDIARRIFANINEKLYIYEDMEFVFRYMLEINTCYITHICKYHYVMRSDSAIHKVNKRYLSNLNEFYVILEDVFSKTEYKEILMCQLNRLMTELIEVSYSCMGVAKKASRIYYINPFINKLNEKKIVIYGAGVVGRDYMELYKKTSKLQVVLWVDNGWNHLKNENINVQPVSAIKEIDYDFILVAVMKEKTYEEIKCNLIEMGVDEEKILWEEPIDTKIY